MSIAFASSRSKSNKRTLWYLRDVGDASALRVHAPDVVCEPSASPCQLPSTHKSDQIARAASARAVSLHGSLLLRETDLSDLARLDLLPRRSALALDDLARPLGLDHRRHARARRRSIVAGRQRHVEAATSGERSQSCAQQAAGDSRAAGTRRASASDVQSRAVERSARAAGADAAARAAHESLAGRESCAKTREEISALLVEGLPSNLAS